MITYKNFKILCKSLPSHPGFWYAQAQTLDEAVILEPTFGKNQRQALKYTLLEILKIETLKRPDPIVICLDNEPVYFNFIARLNPHQSPASIDGDLWVEQVFNSQSEKLAFSI